MDGSSAKAYSQATLGKYRLLAELGHGGMASVYLAALSGPAGFSKLIVLKEIKPELAEDPDFLAMFLDEARLAARLSHPNVVQTNEVGQDGRRFFIAMEYLDGQPYSRVLSRLKHHGVPLAAHLRILAGVLAGLHHAHELCDYDGSALSVVHRDATPQNVFVTYDGQVKVVDFGIAKAATSSLETATGVMKGKIAYMAPEQARGDKVDRRADIFSVGVMLWEAGAGRRMWKGVNDIVILQNIATGRLPSLREMNPDVPARFDAIVQRALAMDPTQRYATAADLQADVESLIDELPERTSMQDVGKLIAAQFDDARLKIKSIVETQLSVLAAPTEDRPPVFGLPMIDHSITTGSETRRIAEPRELTSPSAAGQPTSPSLVAATAPPSSPDASSLTASTATAPEAAPRRGLALPIGVGAGAVGLLVVLFLALRGGAPQATPIEPAGAPATAAVPVAFTLRIESSPPGASVMEGDVELGTTPLALPLDPAQTDVRRLVITKAGYVAYTVSQPPGRSDVRIVATLDPEPAAGPSAEPLARTSPTRTVVKPAATTAPTAAPTTSPLQIRTKR